MTVKKALKIILNKKASEEEKDNAYNELSIENKSILSNMLIILIK